MLVLSRQRDETIMIGDEIEISVVDIRGDKVRLGITAPTRIAVHRKEVYDSIKRENESASHINDPDIHALSRAIGAGPQRTKIGTKGGGLTIPAPKAVRLSNPAAANIEPKLPQPAQTVVRAPAPSRSIKNTA